MGAWAPGGELGLVLERACVVDPSLMSCPPRRCVVCAGSLGGVLEAGQCFSAEVYATDLGISDAPPDMKVNCGERLLRALLRPGLRGAGPGGAEPATVAAAAAAAAAGAAAGAAGAEPAPTSPQPQQQQQAEQAAAEGSRAPEEGAASPPGGDQPMPDANGCAAAAPPPPAPHPQPPSLQRRSVLMCLPPCLQAG